MPFFYVNSQPQPNGDHEVHQQDGCVFPPNEAHRQALGWHLDCAGAVAEAARVFPRVNGCYHCCNACHTG